MRKHIIISPEFGSFRAGEPVAYDELNKTMHKLLRNKRLDDSDPITVSYLTKYGDVNIEYSAVKESASVTIASFGDFRFDVIVVSNVKEDIREDADHKEGYELYKKNVLGKW